jgi:hypothetical protein
MQLMCNIADKSSTFGGLCHTGVIGTTILPRTAAPNVGSLFAD